MVLKVFLKRLEVVFHGKTRFGFNFAELIVELFGWFDFQKTLLLILLGSVITF